jgi:hypothetical protein
VRFLSRENLQGELFYRKGVNDMKKIFILIVILIFGLTGTMFAQENGVDNSSNNDSDNTNEGNQSDPVSFEPGESMGFGFSAGLIGMFAPINLSLSFPKIGNSPVNFGIRASWSMPAISIPHYNEDETEVLLYLPWIVYLGGYMHINSSFIKEVLVGYFGLEILAGSTFATQEGLVGYNISLGAIPYGGVDFYLSKNFSLFVEGGISVVLTPIYFTDGEINTAFHGGFGFFIRFGGRVFFN